jgi:hypothetical protein
MGRWDAAISQDVLMEDVSEKSHPNNAIKVAMPYYIARFAPSYHAVKGSAAAGNIHTHIIVMYITVAGRC